MLTQALIDDLSDKNWVAVTSAEQIAFVTPIFSSSEENWTHGVVVWRINANDYQRLNAAVVILTSAPSYVEALDISDIDAAFSDDLNVDSVLRLISGDDTVRTIRTETPDIDLRRILDRVHCEVGTLERHTTTRLYSSSINFSEIRYLWANREKNIVLTEGDARRSANKKKKAD